MEKLNIYVQRTPNRRGQNVGVHIVKESSEDDIKEIILLIKKALKKSFPDTEIHITPSADTFLR